MGVFGTTDELLDQRYYPYGSDTEAKSVRKYFAYYSTGENQPIGFSNKRKIHLEAVDTYALRDTARLSACTIKYGLWRCGAANAKSLDFFDKYKIVFYYRK